MDLHTLSPTLGVSLYNEQVFSDVLDVREFEHYRWFHLSSPAVQSLMNTAAPAQILLPVPQSMLLFMLWKKSPLRVLNLGLGGGVFERFFNSHSTIDVVSVEQSQSIINMAKQYFDLPEKTTVVNQSAQQYLKTQNEDNDVMLIDIYENKSVSSCLFHKNFYRDMNKNVTDNGVVFINLIVDSKKVLLELLGVVGDIFQYSALVEFSDYKNLVLILSRSPIPDKEQLVRLNNQGDNVANINFDAFIDSLHYLTTK